VTGRPLLPATPRPVIGAKRRPTVLSPSGVVEVRPLLATHNLPVLIRAAVGGLDLPGWAQANRAMIDTHLLAAGAVLLRDFETPSLDAFRQFMAAVSDTAMEYRYRSTPRHTVSPGIYTSTEYPRSQTIPLHNEMAYAREWPGRIAFYCWTPATRGGATPICDSRAVLAGIPAAIRRRFVDRGVMYVRHHRPGIDLSWQDVFQTEDRAEVEAYCRAHDIGFVWRDDKRLETRQVCQAVATHPQTGEQVWFNQAHLFHVSALAPGVREALLTEHGDDGLPRHACYGDGSPIDLDDLTEIRAAYSRAAISFPWEPGDVLLLDNLLAAHGRDPFDGPREVVVAMANPQHR
jgi:alpha-ketoglutarate-dependent taurine dioxygenase